MTYEIPGTQFLRPDGRQRKVRYPTEDKTIYDKAMAIIAAGFRLEVEELTTLEYHGTISDDHDDYASVVCPNDETVRIKTDAMILDFDIEAAKQRSKEMQEGPKGGKNE